MKDVKGVQLQLYKLFGIIQLQKLSKAQYIIQYSALKRILTYPKKLSLKNQCLFILLFVQFDFKAISFVTLQDFLGTTAVMQFTPISSTNTDTNISEHNKY